ncbi:MAG: energy transducer TonB, partial [Phaeodactylibacter sp.]|nr:energy transducer TonB [Phaeodactylibacter sp.]
MDVSITGGTLGGLVFAIIAGIIAIIVVMKSVYAQRASKGPQDAASQSSKSPLDSRTKYPWADAFKYSGTFFNLGLVLALGLTVLAFGWTQYEEEVYIP